MGELQPEPQHYAPRPTRWDTSADDDPVDEEADDEGWINEDIKIAEGVTDGLLQLEFHTGLC